MTILAIDPGISTGVAIYVDTHIEVYKDVPADQYDEFLKAAEYLMLVVTEPIKLWDLVQAHRPSVIVCENFAAGGLISKDGQATIRLVGAMELAAYITDAEFVLQFPSERKPFIPVARQMLIQRGRTPISHEVDSLSHLLLYQHREQAGIKHPGRRSFASTTTVRH